MSLLYICLYSECEGQAAFNKPVQGNPSKRRHCVIDRRGLASSGCQFIFFQQCSQRRLYKCPFGTVTGVVLATDVCLLLFQRKEEVIWTNRPRGFLQESGSFKRVAVKCKTKAKMWAGFEISLSKWRKRSPFFFPLPPSWNFLTVSL